MAFAALGAHEFAPAAVFESLGRSLVRFNLGQLSVSQVYGGCIVQTNWGTTPSPVLWQVPSTTIAVQALLNARAQDHKHSTSLPTGSLLDMAYIF